MYRAVRTGLARSGGSMQAALEEVRGFLRRARLSMAVDLCTRWFVMMFELARTKRLLWSELEHAEQEALVAAVRRW
jgi:hypothetical protein